MTGRWAYLPYVPKAELCRLPAARIVFVHYCNKALLLGIDSIKPAFLCQRSIGNADLRFPGQHLIDLFQDGNFVQLIVDLRIFFGKFAEVSLNKGNRHRRRQADSQSTCIAVDAVRYFPLGIIFQRTEIFSFVIKNAAGIGQFYIMYAATDID